MSLKLIRAAIRATTTNPEILIAEEVRSIIKSKGLPLVESDDSGVSLDITPEDYDRWMAVAHDEAKQEGVVIRSKPDLAKYLMYILDNDPKIESQSVDQEELKERIINTMWNAHKATMGHVGVTKHVNKVREEEEQSGFGQAFRTAQGVEDEQKSDSFVKSAVTPSANNPYEPGTLRYALWLKLHGGEEEELHTPDGVVGDDDADLDAQPSVDDDSNVDADADTNPDMDDDSDVDAAAADDTDDVDDTIDGADDVDADAELDDGEQDPEEVLADLSTEDLEAELARRRGEDGDDEDDDTDVDADDETSDADADVAGDPEAELGDDDQPDDAEDDNTPDAIANRITGGVEDEQLLKSVTSGMGKGASKAKNIFHHALTRPKDEMKAAMKEIEKEGQDAWKNVNVAKNPYEPNTEAWKVWNRSHIQMAKVIFGIKDPKPATAKKKKR